MVMNWREVFAYQAGDTITFKNKEYEIERVTDSEVILVSADLHQSGNYLTNRMAVNRKYFDTVMSIEGGEDEQQRWV